MPQDIPAGLCQCGCGQRTARASQTYSHLGYIKGQPMRFRQGHGGHEKLRKAIDDLYVVADCGYHTPCWVWQGGTTGNGYGRTKHNGRMQPAHRVFYERVYGPISDGLQMDHLCRNHGCVNPDHLEAVTPAENSRRGPNTKLTWQQINEIRNVKARLLAADPVTCQGKIRRRVPNGVEVRKALAAQYGVRADYIKEIWRGETWRP